MHMKLQRYTQGVHKSWDWPVPIHHLLEVKNIEAEIPVFDGSRDGSTLVANKGLRDGEEARSMSLQSLAQGPPGSA